MPTSKHYSGNGGKTRQSHSREVTLGYLSKSLQNVKYFNLKSVRKLTTKKTTSKSLPLYKKISRSATTIQFTSWRYDQQRMRISINRCIFHIQVGALIAFGLSVGETGLVIKPFFRPPPYPSPPHYSQLQLQQMKNTKKNSKNSSS